MRSGPDDGVTSIEFVAVLPILFVVTALVWQMLLVGAAGSAVQHAARNGSRVAGQGADPVAVADQVHDSLPGWLRAGDVDTNRPGGSAVEVVVDMPLLFPGLTSTRWSITRRAELPPT